MKTSKGLAFAMVTPAKLNLKVLFAHFSSKEIVRKNPIVVLHTQESQTMILENIMAFISGIFSQQS